MGFAISVEPHLLHFRIWPLSFLILLESLDRHLGSAATIRTLEAADASCRHVDFRVVDFQAHKRHPGYQTLELAECRLGEAWTCPGVAPFAANLKRLPGGSHCGYQHYVPRIDDLHDAGNRILDTA